jgi:hypothetical protein
MDDVFERIEIEALADFWQAAPPATRAALGLDVDEIGDATCFRCRELQPTLMFRRAVGLGLRRPASPEDLDAIAAHMRDARPSWGVAVAPMARPAALADELARRGFQPAYAWMKFKRPCVRLALPQTDLQVRTLEAPDGAAFAAVVGEGFGVPPVGRPWLAALPGRAHWICVAAFDRGQAVAAAAAYVGGDTAWLGFAATLPAARRRGAQNALLSLRIDRAAAAGARVAVTETGERVPDKPSHSYRNILRAGFEEAYLRRHFIREVTE